MFMNDLCFYTICVHMLVYINDYKHNAYNEWYYISIAFFNPISLSD
jgi:hypothetical protein